MSTVLAVLMRRALHGRLAEFTASIRAAWLTPGRHAGIATIIPYDSGYDLIGGFFGRRSAGARAGASGKTDAGI